MRPSQNRQRQANPRGITRRPHHHLIGLISLISLMQASRPRRQADHRCHQVAQHYPGGVSALHYPGGKSCARAKPDSGRQTHGERDAPIFVRQLRQVKQVRQVRLRRHASADCHPRCYQKVCKIQPPFICVLRHLSAQSEFDHSCLR